MPPILKPDLKAAVWLLVGMFVAPRAYALVKAKLGQ